MIKEIKLSFMLSNNLGDGVYISPLFKSDDIRVKLFLKPDQLGKAFYQLYKRDCDIEFYDTYDDMKKDHPDAIESHDAVKKSNILSSPLGTINNKTKHIPRLLLDYFGLEEIDSFPKINVHFRQKVWACNFIEEFKDPIAILPGNCGSGERKEDNFFAVYRTPPFNFLQEIVDKYSGKHDFLQFGVSPNFYREGYSNFHPLNGVIKLLDLPIDKLAALYSQIRKMISGDTGDCHLMLAVGGKANILVPDNDDNGYSYQYLHYPKEQWRNRVRYINFKDMSLENVINYT